MKKLTASLIALTLCAFTPIARAWHAEHFVAEDGTRDFRMVEDSWDKEPLQSWTAEEIEQEREKERNVKPVEKFSMSREGSRIIIYDETNARKWRCTGEFPNMTCERSRY